jgi:benzoylformate decarboxylase
MRVTDPGQLKSMLSSAISRPGTKLIEVVVNNSVN